MVYSVTIYFCTSSADFKSGTLFSCATKTLATSSSLRPNTFNLRRRRKSFCCSAFISEIISNSIATNLSTDHWQCDECENNAKYAVVCVVWQRKVFQKL